MPRLISIDLYASILTLNTPLPQGDNGYHGEYLSKLFLAIHDTTCPHTQVFSLFVLRSTTRRKRLSAARSSTASSDWPPSKSTSRSPTCLWPSILTRKSLCYITIIICFLSLCLFLSQRRPVALRHCFLRVHGWYVCHHWHGGHQHAQAR